MNCNTALTMVFLTAMTAGCGDGPAGTPVAATPAVPVATAPAVPLPPAQDLQSTVPVPTYAAGSQELSFFNAFNDFRARLGLGKLVQNTKLDTAARNHLEYQVQNPDLDLFATDPGSARALFHIESPGRPGFTGIQELDRARFAGYAGTYVGETGSFGLGKGAAKSLNDLLATVYHRAALMYQAPRDVGIAVGTDTNETVIVVFGHETKGQANAAGYFGHYPGDRQTDVPRVAASELPNPIPGIALADYPARTSYPVNVVSGEGATLQVYSFTVTEAGARTPLETRLLTKDGDPHRYLAGNDAYLVGTVPFRPGTTYQVAFAGSVNGTAVSRSWSFTTES